MKIFSYIQIIWGGLLSLGNIGFIWVSSQKAAVQQAAIDSGDISSRRERALKTFVGLVEDTQFAAKLLILGGLLFVTGGVLIQLRKQFSEWVIYSAFLVTLLIYAVLIFPLSGELTYLLHFKPEGKETDGEPQSMMMMALAAVLLLAVPVASVIFLAARRKALAQYCALR